MACSLGIPNDTASETVEFLHRMHDRHMLFNITYCSAHGMFYEMCLLTVLEWNASARRAYMCVYLLTYVHAYLCTYMHICIHAYIHTFIQTNIRTYVLIYIHTHIRAYIHTYIHTCLIVTAHCFCKKSIFFLNISLWWVF